MLGGGMIIFLMISGFIAAFVDSAVGGGGLISIPALFFTGLPPNVVLGTNKMAATLSSCTSTLAFIKSGKVNKHFIFRLFPVALVGSVAGVFVVGFIPAELLKPLVVILLIIVTIYTIFKKQWGENATLVVVDRYLWVRGTIMALVLGFYDGFFGPGTGSFLIFGLIMMGFDFIQAAGNAKVLNFASNLGSVVTFALLGYVNYHYALPMGVAMVAGAIAGSRVAITKGITYVRPLFIVITIVLISKQLWDLLH